MEEEGEKPAVLEGKWCWQPWTLSVGSQAGYPSWSCNPNSTPSAWFVGWPGPGHHFLSLLVLALWPLGWWGDCLNHFSGFVLPWLWSWTQHYLTSSYGATSVFYSSPWELDCWGDTSLYRQHQVSPNWVRRGSWQPQIVAAETRGWGGWGQAAFSVLVRGRLVLAQAGWRDLCLV